MIAGAFLYPYATIIMQRPDVKIQSVDGSMTQVDAVVRTMVQMEDATYKRCAKSWSATRLALDGPPSTWAALVSQPCYWIPTPRLWYAHRRATGHRSSIVPIVCCPPLVHRLLRSLRHRPRPPRLATARLRARSRTAVNAPLDATTPSLGNCTSASLSLSGCGECAEGVEGLTHGPPGGRNFQPGTMRRRRAWLRWWPSSNPSRPGV